MSGQCCSSSYPTRAVLEGVPKVGYFRHLCPFPGSLYACMKYLGDPCDYDYLMGVTGAAFRRLWNRDDGGNVDLMYLAPEPHTRAFRALGYECRTVPKDRQAMIQAVKESVARGVPVIAFGIIGPPEAGIVAGYDRDGAVLYGYSYFQDRSIQGYYEKDDWFEAIGAGGPYGLIVIGEKVARPPEREILVSTLEWVLDLAHTSPRPGVPDHAAGLAAYEAWAAGFEVDEDYPPGNAEVLGLRAVLHGDQTVMLEERRNAARYLRSMVEVAPEAAGYLKAAAALYDEVPNTPGIWLWGCNIGPEVGQALADAETRKGIAAQIRAAREKEAAAVEQVEKALAALK